MCGCKMPFSDTHLNILDLCRLCLGKENILIPVFDSSLLGQQLCDKISVCLAVEIKSEDEVSQKICNHCLTKVNLFYDYRNATLECQKVLQRWVSEANQKQLNFEIENAPLNNKDTNEPVKEESTNELNKNSETDESDIDYDSRSDSESCNSDRNEVDNVSKDLKSVDSSVHTSATHIVLPESEVPGPSGLQEENTESPVIEEGRLKGTVDSTLDKMSELQCGKCKSKFKTNALLKDHIKEAHSTHFCHCGAKFTSARYLARHESRHNAKPTIPCKLCNKLFITTSEMKDHQKSHQVGQKLNCHLCSYVSLYKSNMVRHLKRHNKDYTVYCDFCNEGFFCKGELSTHRIKKHGAEPFFCSICSKSFTSKRYLNEHNKTMHFTSTKDFLCETCGKAFKTKTAIRKHMKIHLGLKYKCHMCKKSVNSSYSLKKHMKTHMGEKNVVCRICGKAFVDNKYMAAHLRTHTGERPYGCTECGKRFTQPTTLKVHLRYHTGERPYLCRQCGVGFVTNSLLNSHIKSHSSHFLLNSFQTDQVSSS